jgi:hypothetical protein
MKTKFFSFTPPPKFRNNCETYKTKPKLFSLSTYEPMKLLSECQKSKNQTENYNFTNFHPIFKISNKLHLFVAMPFLCILHAYATFRYFWCKSDIYTQFQTFSGHFAPKLLYGRKAPLLNLSPVNRTF